MGVLAAVAAGAQDLPPETAARWLMAGALEPEQAVAAWEAAGLEPEAALELVQGLAPQPDPALTPGTHTVELRDASDRESEAYLFVPEAPQEDGTYRVLVFLHGIGGNNERTFEGGCRVAPPHTIVIGPSSIRPPKDEPYEDLRTASRFGVDVMKRFKTWWRYQPDAFPLQALRFVRQRFPVDHDGVVLAGYSMGGFGTWNLGLRYHERFAALAPMAGGISREEFALGSDEVSRWLLGNARGTPCWVLHGDEDEVVPVKFDRATHEALTAAKVEHVYHEVKGGKHLLTDFFAGDALTAELRDWIGAQRRDAHPALVEHFAIGAYHGGAYWLRVDELDERGRILARAKKSKVQVLVQGVKRFTLYLDPEVVDAGRRITVTVNGKTASKGKVEPSLLAVAESLRRSGDPRLAYCRALTVEVPAGLPEVPEAAWAAARK
ncbi:MAG: alpha/beta hydrolase-fold protein [Planctomycetota bacterium]